MAYTVKARYYAESDNFGESYVLTSDNSEKDTNIEVGKKVEIMENVVLLNNSKKINELNGIPIIPHLYRSMSGIKEDKLRKILDKISTIEVLNSCSEPQTNLKTAKIAKKYNLGGTGGSDSHTTL
mgnify:CR=1 FL=1